MFFFFFFFLGPQAEASGTRTGKDCQTLRVSVSGGEKVLSIDARRKVGCAGSAATLQLMFACTRLARPRHGAFGDTAGRVMRGALRTLILPALIVLSPLFSCELKPELVHSVVAELGLGLELSERDRERVAGRDSRCAAERRRTSFCSAHCATLAWTRRGDSSYGESYHTIPASSRDGPISSLARRKHNKHVQPGKFARPDLPKAPKFSNHAPATGATGCFLTPQATPSHWMPSTVNVCKAFNNKLSTTGKEKAKKRLASKASKRRPPNS